MSVEQTADKVAEQAKANVASGAEKLEQTIDRAADAGKQGIHKVRQNVDGMVQEYQAMCDGGRDMMESAVMCTKDVVRKHPVTSLAVVGLLAYLCGRLR